MNKRQQHFKAQLCRLLIRASLLLIFTNISQANTTNDLSTTIIKQLESGKKQQALRKLKTLRNKHYAGFNVEGKTCQRYPEFILMVAIESSIRNKQRDLTRNYLQQLQCLINVNNKNLKHENDINSLIKNRRFKPAQIHLCPNGLGTPQIQQAKQWLASGNQEKATQEALRASCLLGISNSQVSTLLNALPQTVKTPIPYNSTSKHPTNTQQPGTKNTSQQSLTNNWIILTIAALVLALIAVIVKRRKQKAGVFISYRRSDSAGWAQTIHDKLAEELGHEEIFMDLHDIPAGTDFVEHLDQTLTDVKTVIVVIGPDWEAGERIHSDGDWVRQEIVHAMKSKKQVIPVLVDHRRMPSSETLPEDLQPMTHLNAITLYPDQLEGGIKRLLNALN